MRATVAAAAAAASAVVAAADAIAAVMCAMEKRMRIGSGIPINPVKFQ